MPPASTLTFRLLCLAALAASCFSAPAAYAVDNEITVVGAACPIVGQNAADWDTIMECTLVGGSNKWVRAPYFVGSTTDTCDTNHAGMVAYDASQNLMRFCDGSQWNYL